MTLDAQLLLTAGLAMAALLLLIGWCKLPGFIALAIASFSLGLGAGRKPLEIARSFSDGFGGCLGSIAMVIALGAILGKAMAVSGSAERLGAWLTGAVRERWILWAVVCAAFLVGIPVFFSVGLVLLIPLISTIARQRQTSLMYLGLPMVVGLSV